MTGESADTVRESGEIIETWLNVVDRASPEGYVPLSDFTSLADGERVQSDSETWAPRFFLPAAEPYHAPPPITRSVHMATEDTFDLLRHDYDVGGLRLSVIETVKFTLVYLEEKPSGVLSAPNPADAIAEIADSLFALQGVSRDRIGLEQPYALKFQFPAAFTDGIRFSTDPAANPRRLTSWQERVDGGIRNDRLYFLFFKAHEADGRIVTLDAYHWFDGKCWNVLQ